MGYREKTPSFHREHLALLLQLALFLLPSAAAAAAALPKKLNSSRLPKFVDDLLDMPKLRGFDVAHGGGAVPKSLQIGMFKKLWKFHRDLPPTPVFAYGTSKRAATVPGPTIEARRGVATNVTWTNRLPSTHILPWDPTIPTAVPRNGTGVPTVVHLHGGIHPADSDGHAKAWYTKKYEDSGPTFGRKTFHYPNCQHPGNLWYHDHAMGLTRVNLLAGLIGAYVIRDPAVEDPLGLPDGDEFDRHLIVVDRSFRVDGSIYMNSKGNNPSIHPQWQPEYFGDAIVVNGKAWPSMRVRRRRYRFRIVNASNARFFRFFFASGLRFVHVGSDSAYLERPVATQSFVLGPSEIADVIVNFAESNASSAVLRNDAPYPYPDGDAVGEALGEVMRFVIRSGPDRDTSRVPDRLIAYPRPDVSAASLTRYITMYEYTSAIDEPTHLYLNARSFDEPATETPRVGATEIWSVINLTDDNHPLHVHLGLFAVLDQTEIAGKEKLLDCMRRINDAVRCHAEDHARGNKTAVPAPESGWKNVYKMKPGFLTRILVRFAPIDSSAPYAFDATAEPGYAYHCHILDHEDNVMMRPLKLTR